MTDIDKSLCAALLTCRTADEMRCFLTDLLSTGEIKKAEQRWALAIKRIENPEEFGINEAKKQKFGSQDKITRVFKSVDPENSGYKLAYRRLIGNQP